MIQTRYAELAYDRYGSDSWRIIDVSKQVTTGPIYPSHAELLADLDRFAQEFGATNTGPKLCYPLEAYRNAPNGVGPMAALWAAEPHRLLYDVCTALEQTGF